MFTKFQTIILWPQNFDTYKRCILSQLGKPQGYYPTRSCDHGGWEMFVNNNRCMNIELKIQNQMFKEPEVVLGGSIHVAL